MTSSGLPPESCAEENVVWATEEEDWMKEPRRRKMADGFWFESLVVIRERTCH